MTQMTEHEMVASVQEAAQKLGYKVEMEPSASRWNIPLRGYLIPATFGRNDRPDLLIRHGDLSAVVEVKNTGVLFGGVEQVLQYAEAFKARGVLCMPDNAYSDVPDGVSMYANGQEISLCPISEIEKVLTKLLGQPGDQVVEKVGF